MALLGGVSWRSFGDLEAGSGVGVQPHSGYDHLSVLGRAVARPPAGLLPGWRPTAATACTAWPAGPAHRRSCLP